MKQTTKKKVLNKLNICFKSNVILVFCNDYDLLHQHINIDYVLLKKNFYLLKFYNKTLTHFLIKTCFINVKQLFISSLMILYPKTFYNFLNKNLFLCNYFVGLIFYHNFYLISQIKNILCLSFYNNVKFLLYSLKTIVKSFYYMFSK